MTALALDLDALRFDERGLLPVVAQEAASGAGLRLAWADREALARTLESGRAWFWSRSRARLWQKGESSGNVLEVLGVRADCDGDAVLLRVRATGPTCHTGSTSCFGEPEPATGDAALVRSAPPPGALDLGWLAAVIEARRNSAPEASYTARLLAGGPARVAQKVGEEASEVVVAALAETRERLAEEAADLLYHMLVLLAAREVPLAAVEATLAARHRDAQAAAAAEVRP